MQYLPCYVCGAAAHPDESTDDPLVIIHKVCDWQSRARYERHFRGIRQREDEWGGKPRDCPKCSFRFVSVQDLGMCPMCHHRFYASEPSCSRRRWHPDHITPLARESEVVAHLDQLKQEIVALIRERNELIDSNALLKLRVKLFTIEEISQRMQCSEGEVKRTLEEMQKRTAPSRERLQMLRAEVADIIDNWDEFASTLD